jgi:hypothetical protein
MGACGCLELRHRFSRKRINGMILIPKEHERPTIERFHDDIREGNPGQWKRYNETIIFPECTEK